MFWQQSQKCVSLAVIAKYITVIYTIGYLQIFTARVSWQRSIGMVFNGTTNFLLILPRKTFQRHLETRAANCRYLVQSDQSPFQQNLACLCQFFHSVHSIIQQPDKRSSDVVAGNQGLTFHKVRTYLFAVQVISGRVSVIIHSFLFCFALLLHLIFFLVCLNIFLTTPNDSGLGRVRCCTAV